LHIVKTWRIIDLEYGRKTNINKIRIQPHHPPGLEILTSCF
jgi:hypothetical protein